MYIVLSCLHRSASLPQSLAGAWGRIPSSSLPSTPVVMLGPGLRIYLMDHNTTSVCAGTWITLSFTSAAFHLQLNTETNGRQFTFLAMWKGSVLFQAHQLISCRKTFYPFGQNGVCGGDKVRRPSQNPCEIYRVSSTRSKMVSVRM